jgi:uncharacterized protein YrrD
MEIELGTDIISRDGHKIGVVDSLVIDPRTAEIESLIVRKGLFFPTDRILPVSLVTSVVDDKVIVSATRDEVENLNEYLDTNYVMPPSGFYGAPGYIWPSTTVYGAGLMVDEQVRQRDPDAIILSEGTLVVDASGDEVGRITELESDERGRVVGFKVEQGLFRHHEHHIPAHFIARVDDNVIVLSVDTDSLEAATDPGRRR